MKTFAVLALVLGVFSASSSVYADQYGAPEPSTKAGAFTLSAGHTYYDSKWKSSDFSSDTKVSQTRVFVQGSYSLSKDCEAYVRGGAANFRSKDFYDDANGGLFGATGWGDFRDGFQPYGAVGVKGIFYSKGIFTLGAFTQGTYQFAEYKSTIFVNQANNVEFKFKNPWDITLGIAGQVKLMGMVLYGGPLAYWTGARVEASGVDLGAATSGSARPHEKNHVGGYLGLKAPLYKSLGISAEVQLKSEISTGASLTYSF
jgi:hypothetical protein